MDYLASFKMPKGMNISERSSTITNAFVNAIIPTKFPTSLEVEKALKILEIDPEDICCAYCGTSSSEWDHLNPLVKDKMPTGFISEIKNLVPACGKCNQSKGNKAWSDWIKSDAKQSPKSKGVADLEDRISRLEEYEISFQPTQLDFKEIIGEELWKEYWENHDYIQDQMREAQSLAVQIKNKVADAYK